MFGKSSDFAIIVRTEIRFVADDIAESHRRMGLSLGDCNNINYGSILQEGAGKARVLPKPKGTVYYMSSGSRGVVSHILRLLLLQNAITLS